jgi:hypothetical protein
MPLNYSAAVQAFLEDLKKTSKADVAKLEAFAAQYAPMYVFLKQTGDTAAAEEIEAAAIGQAAVLGIDNQAAIERAVKSALDLATSAALR